MLRDGIDKTIKRGSTRFTVPGHKAKRGGILHYDVTELEGTDNLVCPDGIIKEAEYAAARAFLAERSFFCVNGSTIGLQALIFATVGRGGKMLVSRNCHVSIINAMALFDITPVFVYPELEPDYGFDGGINPLEVERQLSLHPDTRAVLITSPTYYGICSNVWEIATIAHVKRIPLIVDEAHGAHLPFSDKLPLSALQSGADACVQSAHKTLSSLTQGALLHVKSNLIDADKVKQCLNLLQTTSPSYLIMSSIDNARHEMEKSGAKLLGKTLRECELVRERMAQLPGVRCLNRAIKGTAAIFDYDETRLVINFTQNTERIRRALQHSYDIFVEFDDGRNIVCVATVANAGVDYFALCNAITEIVATTPPEDERTPTQPLPRLTAALPPYAATQQPSLSVSIPHAIGRISAKTICNYPPGTPIIVAGEIITEEAAALVRQNVIDIITPMQ